MVDQSAESWILGIGWGFRSVLVADVLHDCDMLRDEEAVVVQHWNLPLRVQLRNESKICGTSTTSSTSMSLTFAYSSVK
jgi:hypothetical protein